MKSELFYITKIVIILVFFTSSISKTINFKGYLKAITDYKIIKSRGLIVMSGIVFLLTEYSIILLTLIAHPKYSTFLGFSILSIYFLAVLINILKRNDINCHCFSALAEEKVTIATLTRIVLIISILIVHFTTHTTTSILNINIQEILVLSLLVAALFFTNTVLQKGLALYSRVKKEYL